MEIKHVYGKNSVITDSEIEEQVDYIISFLKTKKQTYTLNKLVLEESINALGEMII